MSSKHNYSHDSWSVKPEASFQNRHCPATRQIELPWAEDYGCHQGPRNYQLFDLLWGSTCWSGCLHDLGLSCFILDVQNYPSCWLHSTWQVGSAMKVNGRNPAEFQFCNLPELASLQMIPAKMWNEFCGERGRTQTHPCTRKHISEKQSRKSITYLLKKLHLFVQHAATLLKVRGE